MDWIKIDEAGEIQFVSEEVKLVPELQAILSLNYNKRKGDTDGRKRYRAKEELKYLYLVYSTKSPYKDYEHSERITEAKLDCSLTADWDESTELKLLIPKFVKGTQSKMARLLITSEKFLDKLEIHLNNIDLAERDKQGNFVNDPKTIIGMLGQLPKLANTLQELEQQVKVGIITNPKSKGDHETGWMMDQQNKTKQVGEDEEDN